MALDEEPRQRHSLVQARHRDEIVRLLALSDGVFAIAITLNRFRGDRTVLRSATGAASSTS